MKRKPKPSQPNNSVQQERKPQTTTPIQSEEQVRFNARNRQRKQLLPKAVALGVLSGLLAVAFRYCLDLGEEWRGEWLRVAHHYKELGLAAVLLVSVLVAKTETSNTAAKPNSL